MKFFSRSINALLAGVALLLLGTIFTSLFQDAQAQINNNQPLPITWMSEGGTNAFGINASAVPFVTYRGTNFTCVTTNVALTNGFRLNIMNGVVVGINPL